MRAFVTVILFVSLAGAAPTFLDAHHSYPGFDRCHGVSIEGKLEEIQWRDPHVLMRVRMGDSDFYNVEWFSLERLASWGIEASDLNVGDRVMVVGSVHPSPEIKLISLLTEFRVIGGALDWSRPAPVARPGECDAQ